MLDLDIDFVWCGTTLGPSLVMLPQDIDYEDSGGWGYLVAAGSEFKERRGAKDWCPSFSWATLLPDTVTDWLSENTGEFVESGKIIVCPANNIGLHKNIGYLSEEHIQRISNSASIIRESAKIETLFSFELPVIDGMPLRDIYKFCQDHQDKLILFQKALSNLLKKSIEHEKQALVKELISQIKEGVAELRLSDKTIKARRILSTLGASISTFLITIGVKLGVDLGTAAIGSTGAAMATLAFWSQILESRGSMRKNPFYIIWALEKGKRTKNIRRKRAFLKEFPPTLYPKTKEIPPHHWLTPPTGGWLIPTAQVP